MKRNLAILCVLILGTCGIQISQATGETSPKIERKIIERIPVEGTDEELQMMLITVPPGAQSEPHVHPVQGMNYIVEGAAESQYTGYPLQHYKAGDSYIDLAQVTHEVFRNPSKTQPLKFIVAFKIKKGVAFKQDLLSPLP